MVESRHIPRNRPPANAEALSAKPCEIHGSQVKSLQRPHQSDSKVYALESTLETGATVSDQELDAIILLLGDELDQLLSVND